jgi:pSer/pThr/pTyr-binding forkhead associated (FHA) protein
MSGTPPRRLPSAGPERTSDENRARLGRGAPLAISTILPSGEVGRRFVLEADVTVCGSLEGAIRFPDDPYLSPRHCQFLCREGTLAVEDLGSLNGIFLRTRGPQAIEAGDQLRLGRQLLAFEGIPAPAQTAKRSWGSPDPGYAGRLLQLLQGGILGEIHPLRSGENPIGRDQGAIRFPADRFISSRHASLSLGADGARVIDLGSSNGTFVRLKKPTPLQLGDRLLLGNQLLRVDPA